MHNRTCSSSPIDSSTVRRADAIVVLERGRVVESGRHDELMARNGAYAKTLRIAAAGRAGGNRDLVNDQVDDGLRSLTHEDERATIGLTIRAVNHRFLDVQLRIPPSVADLEPRMLMQKRLARGRVELAISVQLRSAAVPIVELNAEFATALSAALDRARERGLVSRVLDAWRPAPPPPGAHGSRPARRGRSGRGSPAGCECRGGGRTGAG